MSVESIVLAALIFACLWAILPHYQARGRRSRHSLLYRYYIDNNSRLWRLRRFLWYWSSNRRCEECGCRMTLHARGIRHRLGAPVMTVHHLTYRRLGHEHREDVELMCWRCHSARDAYRFRG